MVLSEQDIRVTEFLLKPLQEEKRLLLSKDLKCSKGVNLYENECIITFQIEGYIHPAGIGQTVISEATAISIHGEPLTILLHCDAKERLYELEYIVINSSSLSEKPVIQWDTLKHVEQPLW